LIRLKTRLIRLFAEVSFILEMSSRVISAISRRADCHVIDRNSISNTWAVARKKRNCIWWMYSIL
jgi:hypothetical protein